jgi:hypothetical protein
MSLRAYEILRDDESIDLRRSLQHIMVLVHDRYHFHHAKFTYSLRQRTYERLRSGMYPYPEKWWTIRRCVARLKNVAATGKVSNALIIRTYVVIFANQRGFPEFARNMLADMPGRMSLRQPIFTAWSDASLHQVLL